MHPHQDSNSVTDSINVCYNTQKDVDFMYSNFVNTIKSEMDKYVLPVQNETKRCKSHGYWNSELNDL